MKLEIGFILFCAFVYFGAGCKYFDRFETKVDQEYLDHLRMIDSLEKEQAALYWINDSLSTVLIVKDDQIRRLRVDLANKRKEFSRLQAGEYVKSEVMVRGDSLLALFINKVQ